MKIKPFTTARQVLFIAVFTVSGCYMVNAQRGQLSIEEEPGISTLLEYYKASETDTDYYSIQVGFGSYNQAERIKREVEIDFPSWGSRIIFDSPTYRVQLGRFETKLDAERAYLEVRQKYPASLLLKPKSDRR